MFVRRDEDAACDSDYNFDIYGVRGKEALCPRAEMVRFDSFWVLAKPWPEPSIDAYN